jgi:peptidyl-prolyl cis-trans isomerase B (cyclophilin B)
MRFSLIFFILCLFAACQQEKNAQAVIHTSLGDIRVRLFDSAPRHRDNFIFLAEKNPADTLVFYRIQRDFAIQFGPVPDLLTHNFILKPEIEAPLLTGALAAAKAMPTGRQADSLQLSDGTDFFIVLGRPQTDASLGEIERKTSVRFSQKEREQYKKYGGLPQLHGQYTVFGEVTEGLEVAQKIAALPRDANGRPLQEVKLWVEILK